MPLASAHNVLFGAFARAVAPRKRTRASAWPERHRVLSPKASAEPGPWRNSRNPLLVEIMDCASASSTVREAVALFCIQFGKSEVEANILGYTMCENPMPIIWALPGEVSMNKIIDQKLNPLIDETPALQQVLVSLNSRETSNRRTFKDFEGGQLYMEHAGDPKRLKSTSAGLVLADEFSSFANSLKTGDDPVALLRGRFTTFQRYKFFMVGTPETEGSCRLTEQWEESDQRLFHVACPDCGGKQPLVWAGLQWTPDLSDCWYMCRDCNVVIREHQKTAMIADAFRRSEAGDKSVGWVPGKPGRKLRGYRANCLYYPVGLGPSWLELAREFLDAVNDPAKLKTFVNDRLAEAWEDGSSKNLKDHLLRDRAEGYRLRTAPHGVLAVTAGVDTQDDRLAVVIMGWGRGLTCWVLDYIELPGDPAEPHVWASLTDLLNRPIQHACGAMVRPEAVAIDAGGHRTEDVKHFARQKRVRRAMAIFGSRAANAPVLGKPKWADVTRDGKVDKKGVQIYQVGGIEITHRLYAWLGKDAEKELADRRIHFSNDLDDAFLGGLVSEVWDPRKGRYVPRRGGRANADSSQRTRVYRNEPLDTVKYAYAATHHQELRLHRHTAADWDAREKALREAAAALGVTALDSRETTIAPLPVVVDSTAITTDDDVPRESNAAPSAALNVRSMVFALVGMAERQRGATVPADVLDAWQHAAATGDGESALHQELLAALDSFHREPSALPADLLDKARRFLAGLPVVNPGARKLKKRGVRSRGVR